MGRRKRDTGLEEFIEAFKKLSKIQQEEFASWLRGWRAVGARYERTRKES